MITGTFGDATVVDYEGSQRVKVRFGGTGHEDYFSAQAIRNGTIKDKMKPTVCGVGYLGVGNFGSKDPAYKTWWGMMERCYGSNQPPTYRDVTVCGEWHNYQQFALWFDDNHINGWQLDKDMLNPEARIYSPETCCFIPQELNKLLNSNAARRNPELPQGVFKTTSGAYGTKISCNGYQHHIGTYDSPEAASVAYRRHKLLLVEELLEDYELSEEVQEAILNRVR